MKRKSKAKLALWLMFIGTMIGFIASIILFCSATGIEKVNKYDNDTNTLYYVYEPSIINSLLWWQKIGFGFLILSFLVNTSGIICQLSIKR